MKILSLTLKAATIATRFSTQVKNGQVSRECIARLLKYSDDPGWQTRPSDPPNLLELRHFWVFENPYYKHWRLSASSLTILYVVHPDSGSVRQLSHLIAQEYLKEDHHTVFYFAYMGNAGVGLYSNGSVFVRGLLHKLITISAEPPVLALLCRFIEVLEKATVKPESMGTPQHESTGKGMEILLRLNGLQLMNALLLALQQCPLLRIKPLLVVIHGMHDGSAERIEMDGQGAKNFPDGQDAKNFPDGLLKILDILSNGANLFKVLFTGQSSTRLQEGAKSAKIIDYSAMLSGQSDSTYLLIRTKRLTTGGEQNVFIP